jgi:hypothetical protein
MIKETSPGLVEPQKTQSPNADPASIRPFNRESLINAIEAERQRIFCARAIAQTAAKLLHELYANERNEPDVGFVLDVVSDLLEDSLAGLDRVTQESL